MVTWDSVVGKTTVTVTTDSLQSKSETMFVNVCGKTPTPMKLGRTSECLYNPEKLINTKDRDQFTDKVKETLTEVKVSVIRKRCRLVN
jgi:hypothetical protein